MVSGFAVNRVRKVGLATSIIGFSLFASALAVMLKGRGVPPPVQFTLALLKNAETFPKEQIEPGTFKITLSPKALEEKSKFFKRSLVVAYHRSYGDNIAVVEFWLPREDGIFYYATEKLMTDWPRGFVIEKIQMNSEKGEIILQPKDRGDPIMIGIGFLGLLAALLGGFFFCIITFGQPISTATP